MSETAIQIQIMLALGKVPGVTIWRNNTGRGVTGKIVNVKPGVFSVSAGRVTDFGLCKGSSDLIGISQVTVTPEMVGTVLGVFLAIEVKSETGKLRPEQKHFIEFVRAAGGVAIIARSVEQAVAEVRCGVLL